MKKCVLCNHSYAEDDLYEVISSLGKVEVCLSCYWDTEECPECHEQVVSEEGICPSCKVDFS